MLTVPPVLFLEVRLLFLGHGNRCFVGSAGFWLLFMYLDFVDGDDSSPALVRSLRHRDQELIALYDRENAIIMIPLSTSFRPCTSTPGDRLQAFQFWSLTTENILWGGFIELCVPIIVWQGCVCACFLWVQNRAELLLDHVFRRPEEDARRLNLGEEQVRLPSSSAHLELNTSVEVPRSMRA